jgi:hypothetical protein
MIAVRSAPPKHVSYTQDSCRRCCAAEGLPGRARTGRGNSTTFMAYHLAAFHLAIKVAR